MQSLSSRLSLSWRIVLLNSICLLTVGAAGMGINVYMAFQSQDMVHSKTMSLLSTQAEQQVTMAVKNVSKELQNTFNQAFQQVGSINRTINNLEKTGMRNQLVGLMRSTLSDNKEVIGLWSFWEPNAIDGMDEKYVDKSDAGSNENGRFAFNVYYDNGGKMIENTTPEMLVGAFSAVSKDDEYSAYSCSIISHSACVFGPDELEIDSNSGKAYSINIATVSIPIMKQGHFAGNTGMDLSIDSLSDKLDQSNQKLYAGHGNMTVIGSFDKVAGNSADKNMAGKKTQTLWPALQQWINTAKSSGKLSINLDEATGTYYVALPFEPIKGAERWTILYSIPKAVVMQEATSLDKELTEGLLKNVTIQVIVCVLIALAGLIVIYWNAGSIVKPILRITDMLKEIAQGEGDLTKRLKTEGKDELATMANWFNQFLDQLQNLIGMIAKATHGLDKSTGENFDVAHKTQEEITKQLQEIDQVATAVHEMAATSQEIAKNSSQTAEEAKSADTIAKHGMKNVHDTTEHINKLAHELDTTVEVINTLTKNSARIGSIINIIFEIAEQTNLLALNAAIESARAGEHGRGFAVVADEVRLLAQRTQKSTHEIQTMIKELTDGTDQAAKIVAGNQDNAKEIVDLAAGAGTAINEMAATVSHISEMSIQIATAIEQQSCTTEEINRNIAAISDVADRVEKSGNKVKESSKTVSHLAAELETLVSKFKIA